MGEGHTESAGIPAAMEGSADALPDSSLLIVALTWGFATCLREVGLAAFERRLLFGCQGAL